MHLVYQLRPAEYFRYRRHLLSLDAESRYTRFGFSISDYAIEQLCDQFESTPLQHRIFVIENSNLEVVAAAHIALVDRQLPELAFSVLKQYQRQGMGRKLMTRAIAWCQNRKIKNGCMICLSSNRAIKKLASEHGVVINHGSESQANIKMPTQTPFSLLAESIDEQLATLEHIGSIQQHFLKTMPLLFLSTTAQLKIV